ncbi:MAG: sensor histidine kinase [Clostridia bacterium]|nr:sensor histidine kinase [Clostridia bacterium]
MKRNRSVLKDCLIKNKISIILFISAAMLNGAVFLLYGVMSEPFIYAGAITAAALALMLAVDYRKEKNQAEARKRLKDDILLGNTGDPCGDTLRDSDYGEMIRVLIEETEKLRSEFSAKKQDDDDYYTAWVHQIKTPIATMKLLLTDDTAEHGALRSELFRIEEYVGMVLEYIRLESGSNDLLIAEYRIDELIRETLRKFAPQFIIRKLKLTYEPSGAVVVTDKKWLCFIMGQIVSNAVKYTPYGEIKVSADGGRVRISDTGIGIAPEDLPRIFEKGYTGVNGRLGQRSSGLGLFLAKKAADLIAVRIEIKSSPGKGSEFSLILPEETGK